LIIGRPHRLVCACAVFVATLGLSAGSARADLFAVSLEYRGGPGCPDGQEFQAMVRARLGYDPFAPGAPDHVFVGTAAGVGAGAIEGHIEWRDSEGKWAGDQTLPVATRDCRHLVRALAAALAVQIQLLATTREPASGSAAPKGTAAPRSTGPPPPASPPQPAAPPQPAMARSPVERIAVTESPAATVETRPAPPTPAAGPRSVWAVGAGTSVAFGLSSGPVLLGRLVGSLAWPHLSVELAAEASVPSTPRRPDGAGVSQQHLLGSAAGCAVLSRWRACLLANAGEVRMTGVDIDRPTSAVAPLLEVGARVGIVQLLGHDLFVDAHADGLINVIRLTDTLDQLPVWTASRLAAAVGIDLGIAFGAHVR
jgi:hypothetical protein